MTDTPEERRALFMELRERAFDLFSEIEFELSEEAARRIFSDVLKFEFKEERKRGQRGAGKELSAEPSRDAERKRQERERKKRERNPNYAWLMEMIERHPPRTKNGSK